MLRETIFHAIETGLQQIAPEIELDEVSPTENLREELDIDSFDFLKLLIGLDEQLGVDIPEEDYEKLISLNDLVAYLTAKLEDK